MIIAILDEFYSKVKTLKKIRVDPVYWVTYYLDERTGEKWIEERLHSELHGGGPPQLRLLENFPWE